MLKYILLLLAVVAYCECNKIIVCYHTNWSQYRQGAGKFFPENIDANLCTHIMYSFANIQGNELVPFEWNDESTEWSKGMYERTMDLKKQNPNLKILLAVGGWNMGSTAFSKIVNNPQNMQSFVNQALAYIKKHKFDGLDLDWEYPSNREGSQPTDKVLFTKLVRDLKALFAPQGLLLTAAVAAGKPTIDTAYEISEIAKDLDFINLMTYDLHGSWEPFTGHNAPLYPRNDETDPAQRNLNVQFAANYWVSKGTPANKLIIGLATYGRSFRLTNPSNTAMGAPTAGPASAGEFTREAGYMAYYEVCQKLKNGWSAAWNDESKVPYAYGNGEWVGYDDIRSLTEKTGFIIKNGYGGAMFWALDTDDFSGNFCGQGRYPLINAVKSALGGMVVTSGPTQPTQPTPSVGPTNPPPTTTSGVIVGDGKCVKDGYFPDVSSGCRNYYVCLFTGTQFATINYFSCPAGLLFDASIGACNYAASVNC